MFRHALCRRSDGAICLHTLLVASQDRSRYWKGGCQRLRYGACISFRQLWYGQNLKKSSLQNWCIQDAA